MLYQLVDQMDICARLASIYNIDGAWIDYY